jgi:hypothetical protein
MAFHLNHVNQISENKSRIFIARIVWQISSFRKIFYMQTIKDVDITTDKGCTKMTISKECA